MADGFLSDLKINLSGSLGDRPTTLSVVLSQYLQTHKVDPDQKSGVREEHWRDGDTLHPCSLHVTSLRVRGPYLRERMRASIPTGKPHTFDT